MHTQSIPDSRRCPTRSARAEARQRNSGERGNGRNFSDRNRQRRSAWTGQTVNQSRATLRMFAEFTRDVPLNSIKRNDVASFLANLARMSPAYGKRSSAAKMRFDELLKNIPHLPVRD